jgi:GNAT superfamily N-acetyltransferase
LICDDRSVKTQNFFYLRAQMYLNMKVRKANREDIEVIVDFQLAMASETEHISLNRDIVFRGVTSVFEDPSRGNYYVAEENRVIVGSLLTTFEWSDWRNGTVLWIQSVYVISEFRRKGVYREMYKFIQEMVNEDSCLYGIRLYADVSNTVAHQAYLNLGMKADHYQTFEWMKS